MSALLPPEFSRLEHLVPEWAIEDGHERYVKRVNSSMDQIQAFYDEVFPVAEEAVAFIDKHKAEPFFLYLQYMDLHQPIAPPEPFCGLFPASGGGARGRRHGDWSFTNLDSPQDLEDPAFRRFRAHRTALYDGALRFIDEEVGR